MAKTGSKSYDPAAIEKRIFDTWQQDGHFHPTPDDRGRDKRFCIMIPLPNVTAALHLGHALNNTLQDILTRWKRMSGCNTLWMLGTDHAGIATQATVEKAILKNEGKNRHDLGREELVRRIWEWKEKFGGRIIEQLKLMGCSGDYERVCFTLDKGPAKAVRHTFFKLFKDGLIYRGKRLVNWDTHLRTAVSDDEVVHETVKGHFWHLKYPVIDPQPGESQHVHVATTRPETMLGDTAVAVHPTPDRQLDRVEAELTEKLAKASEKEKPDVQAALDDLAERRKTLLPTLLALRDMAKAGRKVSLPLVDRSIDLICDEWAKPEMGSGCVKVTPAHDPNDYDVGQRHDLPMINVLTEDGKVARIIEPDGTPNPNSEKYEGLRFATKGREKVVADLEALGLVERVEDHVVDIGHSDRSKTPIEPFLSDQWFVKMGDLEPEHAARVEGLRNGASGLCQMAMDAVEDGRVRFFPARYEKTYIDWLSEKRDWCISRQLWWGHRIPVWDLAWDFGGEVDETFEARINEKVCRVRDDLAEYMKTAGVGTEDYLIQELADWHWRICARSDLATRSLATLEKDFYSNYLLQKVEPGKPIEPPHSHAPEFEQAMEVARKFKSDILHIKRDPDVLDTWFSSALWPHSTLGWPDEEHGDATNLLGYFYPGNVLITAREIITLWVARMVMTGLYNIGDIPFSDVIIHSVIQDGQGRKMSKTLGNGVDPQNIIDEYGADALRFTLADQATETQDIRMPVKPKKLPDGRTILVSERFEKGRNFCNKLWQASTGFIISNLTDAEPRPLDPAGLPLQDRWILSRMTACLEDLDRAIENYRFSEAVQRLYRFMWNEVCDWTIEMAKPRLLGPDKQTCGQVLAFVLDRLLRMLHPFVPFVTEAIWQELNEAAPVRGLREPVRAEPALIAAAWPTPDPALRDERVEADMARLQAVIKAVREIRTEVNDFRARSGQSAIRSLPSATVRAEDATCRLLDAHRAFILPLAGCDTLHTGADLPKPPGSRSRVEADIEVYVPVADLVDSATVRRSEEARLEELRAAVERTEKQLANPNFVERADPAVVAQTRQRRDDQANQIRLIEQHLDDI